MGFDCVSSRSLPLLLFFFFELNKKYKKESGFHRLEYASVTQNKTKKKRRRRRDGITKPKPRIASFRSMITIICTTTPNIYSSAILLNSV